MLSNTFIWTRFIFKKTKSRSRQTTTNISTRSNPICNNQNQNAEDVITVSDNRYFEKEGENLYIYEKNTRDKIKAEDKRVTIDQQCKTIAP